MRLALIATSAALIRVLIATLLMRPKGPWALIVSGNGARGLNVSGLLNTIEECEILKKTHLQKSKMFIEQKDEKDVIERDGLLVKGTTWETATCLPLHRLPGLTVNFSKLEAALNEVVDTMSFR
jgi:hypothetical protein